jgi:hypothetical protein
MKNNFKNVNNPLKAILTKYHLVEPYTENFIIKNWSDIIDKALFDVIKPVSLKHKILELKIINFSWKTELENRRETLCEKINHKLDNYEIQEIKFISE